MRPSGMRRRSSASISGEERMRAVAMGPGASAFTRMPAAPHSTAMVLTRALMAALAAP